MEPDDPGEGDASISAYAKLEFDHFSFFIQTLTLIVGRKAKRDDNIDVHLGMSKSISRVHAKIYYQFDAMSWEIEVLGKNGAFVNERYVEAGQIYGLATTDKVQIADIEFSFLLPEGASSPRTHTYTDTSGARYDRKPTPGLTPFAIQTEHLTSNSTQESTGPRQFMPVPKSNLAECRADQPYSSVSKVPSSGGVDASRGTHGDSRELDTNVPAKKPRKKYTKRSLPMKVEDFPHDLDDDEMWSTIPRLVSSSPEPDTTLLAPLVHCPDPKTEEERKAQEEEAAAQHAAQLLHQERLARQAQEEEEGLILPPAETDPAVIANLQKPTASYATMIYNAITSHEKKKMTLAQIYSWICIYHPFYRYVQNGWQNSIRHNLSLNKAFMKVSRTDDEPGKGSFWAVDPESEMLFEGGVYKKKPPRSTPLVSLSRGSPVVMKDGKLALNPNYFIGSIQGKAEEVLRTLHSSVQRQLGHGNHADYAVQLAQILALALATQLRQSVITAASVRQNAPSRAPAPQTYQPQAGLQHTQSFPASALHNLRASNAGVPGSQKLSPVTTSLYPSFQSGLLQPNVLKQSTISSSPSIPSLPRIGQGIGTVPGTVLPKVGEAGGAQSPGIKATSEISTATTGVHGKRSLEEVGHGSVNKIQKVTTAESVGMTVPLEP